VLSRTCRLVLWMAAAGSQAAAGQGFPGTNLSVDVKVSSVQQHGDTVRVEYVLTNSPASTERLVFFTVDAPAKANYVNVPRPSEAWDVRSDFRGRSVAEWVALETIGQGKASPPLWFRAIGLPAIVTAWYRGNALPTLGEDDPDAPESNADSAAQGYDPLLTASVPIKTVGVGPVQPQPTSVSFIARLDSLTDQACTLSWITVGKLCATLRERLSSNPARLREFESDLEAGHGRRGPITDNAYWLLKVNAEYIDSLNAKRQL
jgi:hypothetical protein